ncbi:4-(cytidine 5'-diphospho)-2-C-methyl-D-erythritol kinase [Hyphomicrobium sp.]|uniref:4-(cytidine 5'-diphospho)-2-C-methyl-D-erythritol kinase n=1 Tax=Hyphomicrobium sp. TaxID=82 RepID=UPI002E361565|nr:4-(cytidine 5'-diphospho)-2-C-methyl-D-erythritol kinase [Hyphomicrobium sp.]HEX2841989.1 4-(cytidine 5'-diphospho)-2-C-methyl-D-erythritol kinase [Hyphomicrobium sp.]
MTAIREFAPAKVNLTLEVPGSRADGMHEVASLVAFASAGDELSLDPAGGPGIEVTGPFADKLTGTNILARAVMLVGEQLPGLTLGSVKLQKALPVAAGIGGGSADAAALLRVAQRIPGAQSSDVDWLSIARSLGADVPACMECRPLWMTGTGHNVEPVAELPVLDAILVNPLAAVPDDKTAQVYRALGAATLGADYVAPSAPKLTNRLELLDFMRARGNHLATAAETVVPDIGAVLGALRALPNVEYAAVSGGGPTCFGIFQDRRAAEAAVREIAARRPNWWAVAATLGSARCAA